jgi:hypothetical protein
MPGMGKPDGRLATSAVRFFVFRVAGFSRGFFLAVILFIRSGLKEAEPGDFNF